MTAKEMAEQFRVSGRTARRHIARGTTPDARRTIGADGKSYPGSQESYAYCLRPEPPSKHQLRRDLKVARNAVRRVVRAEAFSDADLAELRIIASEAGDLLRRWTNAVEAT
jgi:hypothetical protein